MGIIKWAEAIKQFEGWKPGSRSFKNHNPGNLRYSAYTASLGAIGKDSGRFCIFEDDRAGFAALCIFLDDAANRRLRPYHVFSASNPYHWKLMPEGRNGDELPDFTLEDFYQVYAPEGDGNAPSGYARFVADKLGTTPDCPIKEIFFL